MNEVQNVVALSKINQRPTLVLRDFIEKTTSWRSPLNEASCELIEECASRLDTLLSTWTVSMSVRCHGETVIDLS